MIRDGITRVGIVGLGGMGRLHAQNLTRLGHELVAGADVSAGSREWFARRFDVRVYETFDELYEREDVDAVMIMTPNRFHEPAAVAALGRGLDVFVEKSLAHSLGSAERIAAATRAADGFCMVGFHNRFSPATTLFTAYHADGRFGELTHVRANYVRRRGIPNPGSWFTRPDLSGGGALIDIGVHAIDLALYVLDFPEVVEVSGATRSDFGGRSDRPNPDDGGRTRPAEPITFDVEDSASAVIRTADGRIISLDVAWAATQEPTEELVVRGTEAGARFRLGGDELTIHRTSARGIDHYVDAELTGRVDASAHEVQDELFLESVVRGEAPRCNTVEQALRVQRIVDAIYRSSETNRAQTVVARSRENLPSSCTVPA